MEEADSLWASVRGMEEAASLAAEVSALPGDRERAERVLRLPCLAQLHVPPWSQSPAVDTEGTGGDSDSQIVGRAEEHQLLALFRGVHPDLPGVSRALQLCRNADRGLHLVAAEDIPAGSVLLVEPAFAWALSADVLHDHCTHCIQPLRQRCVACPACQQVVFCSEACLRLARASYHGRECRLGVCSFLASPLLGCAALLALRTVFAEDAASPQLYSLRRVREQLTHADARAPADMLRRCVAAAYVARRLHPDASADDDAVVTLAGRLLTSMQACSCNAYQLSEQLLASPSDKQGVALELGGAVYPAVSLLNHGCWPSVSRHSAGRLCVVRACRPVPRGTELLDNYGPSFLTERRDERRRQLSAQYFFTCVCTPCVENWPLLQDLPPTRFKCCHCRKPVGSDLAAVRHCPHCKKKLDHRKSLRKLEEVPRSHQEAVGKLLEGRFPAAVQLSAKCMAFLDSVVVHPSLEFLKCQQVVNQCWSLTGNTNVRDDSSS